MPTTERNAFTVDLEDWYHGLTSTNRRPEMWSQCESRVVQNTGRLLGLLAEHNVKATFFVLGKVAEQYPDLIRSIAAQGHEIGVHGYAHRNIRRLDPPRFAAELEEALTLLQPLTPHPIIGHRAPYFSIDRSNLWALDVLAERGFVYDASVFPARNGLYGYPGAPRCPYRVSAGAHSLIEFPAATIRLAGLTIPMAGGFGARMTPGALLRWTIRRLNKEGVPAVTYVHPWELDTAQHYNQVTLRERVTHYWGRSTTQQKLSRLFASFEFGPLRDLIETVPM